MSEEESGGSYYKQIDGVKYDRAMLEHCDESVEGAGDGRISLDDAKGLLELVKDANSYSDTEKRTMKYIRDNYKWTEAADEWIRKEIRKWAGERGASS